MNNLRSEIFEECERERMNAGAPARASEEILLQKLEQGPIEGRARVPLQRPVRILDLEHHQDTERLPEIGHDGLCCGKKHYWKGRAYDMVLPVKVLNEIAIFPINAGDNPFEIASSYCRRQGIHDFKVLEGIVNIIKEEVPERFLDLTPVAPAPAEKRSKPVTPFVPILQRTSKKKAQKKERKETITESASRVTVDVEDSSSETVAAAAALAPAGGSGPPVNGAVGNNESEEDEKENTTASAGGESIADQLRMAQERRRLEHAKKRQEEKSREKERELERERQLAREYQREQEERDRRRRELQALSPEERLRLLKEELLRIEREEEWRR